MKIINLFLTLFLGIFMCSCRNQSNPQTVGVSISQTIPFPTGAPEFGVYGLYRYSVYKYSVSFQSDSPDVSMIRAEVHDSDRDETFDSVWVLYTKGWKYFSVLKSHQTNTADFSTFQGYVALANYAKYSIKERNKKIEKAQELFKDDPKFKSQMKLQSFFQESTEPNWYRR